MTANEIAAVVGVSITDVKYVITKQWVPLIQARRQMKDGKTRLFSLTESFAIAMAACMHDDGVPAGIIMSLMSHVAPQSPRRDFPYAIEQLLTSEEPLHIYGSQYFGTELGDKYSIANGSRVRYPIGTIVTLSINLPAISLAVRLHKE